MVPCPVIITIWVLGWFFLISFRVSIPSMPGIQISSSTRSGSSLSRILSASYPLVAVRVSNPSSARIPLSDFSMDASSSTIRIDGNINAPSGTVDRQFEHKPGPLGRVVLGPDPAVVIGYDSTDDGKAQTHARFFGGKVRFKQKRFVILGNALTGVRDRQVNFVMVGITGDLHGDMPLSFNG